MTRRRAGDLAANYLITVEQNKLDVLHVRVELTTGPTRFAQWWVMPSTRAGAFIVSARADFAPVSFHKTYEQACTRAHRNALIWLHSALGTGIKAPRRLP